MYMWQREGLEDTTISVKTHSAYWLLICNLSPSSDDSITVYVLLTLSAHIPQKTLYWFGPVIDKLLYVSHELVLTLV